MKRIVLIILVQFAICIVTYGQNISIEIDKKKYKLDEKIEVTFSIEFSADSIKLPDFKGFSIVNGPSVSSSSSIMNGKQTVYKSWKYILRPKQSGNLYIESPICYLKGKEINGKKKKIVIADSDLTEQEKTEYRFNAFVEDFKPEGTYRYILNEEFGYIEILKGLKWEFYRKLSETELEVMRKIK